MQTQGMKDGLLEMDMDLSRWRTMRPTSKTPEPTFPDYDLRTTWHCKDGCWRLLEQEINWRESVKCKSRTSSGLQIACWWCFHRNKPSAGGGFSKPPDDDDDGGDLPSYETYKWWEMKNKPVPPRPSRSARRRKRRRKMKENETNSPSQEPVGDERQT